jgi:hypothetical protein
MVSSLVLLDNSAMRISKVLHDKLLEVEELTKPAKVKIDEMLNEEAIEAQRKASVELEKLIRLADAGFETKEEIFDLFPEEKPKKTTKKTASKAKK